MQIGQKGNVVVSGFVPKDAEISFVGDKQTPKTKFSIKASGRNEEPVVWVNVVAWSKWALIASSIKKGDEVLVAGRVASREYNEKIYTELTAEYIGIQPFVPDNIVPCVPKDSTVPPPMSDLDEDLPF